MPRYFSPLYLKQWKNSGTTYDFNQVVGARLDFNYDIVGEERIKRAGLQANFHLLPIFSEAPSKFGIDLHAGLGWANNSNAMYNDGYYFRGDDAIIGVRRSF